MKYSNYENPENSTGLLFWQTSLLWQRSIKESLQPLGLTHTQFVILSVIEELSERAHEITQKMISDFSMVDTMTVSSTIRLLEKKGYVDRTHSKSDARAYSVINTELGKAAIRKAVQKVEMVDDRFFFNNEEELESFRENMRTLISKNSKESDDTSKTGAQ